MNVEEAQDLVLFEGKSPNGMVVATRLFEFPSVIRIHVLMEALEVLFKHYEKFVHIDRDIMHALYCIAFHTQTNIEEARLRNVEIEPQFDEDILIVYLMVESIIENNWLIGAE